MRYFRNIKRYAAVAGIIVILWIILALLISSITFITAQQQENYPLNIAEIIAFEIQCIAPWIFSTPLIIWVTQKYRFDKSLLFTSIPVHFFTALFVFVFHSVVQSYEVSVYFDYALDWAYIKRDFMSLLDMRIILYIGVILGVYAVDLQQKIRESRLRKSCLKAQLNRAHYQALLNQIQPTFLLNTIDAIKEKSKVNSDGSEQLLTDFSDLLRIMLQNGNGEEVTVQEDLESFRIYARLLEQRLGQEIDTDLRIEDACYEVLTPPFLMLIPVIEEIVFMDENDTGKFRKISYGAVCQNGEVDSTIILSGIEITPEQLDKHLHKIQFPDIVKRLENKYGEEVNLKVRSVSGRLRIDMTVSFTRRVPEQV